MADRSETKRAKEERGLKCARCGCRHFFVVYVRPARGNRLMRRRECRNCGHRVTTYESTTS